MCGINGFIGSDQERLSGMNRRLGHRGPDFAGSFDDGRLSMGHVLLSIRDAADVSRQPYRREGSPWVLGFNGQLYNTRALKAFLGPEYRDVDLDTALLYALIEREGWNFIERIHGMFAISLYNADEGVVRLYRDPSGQKPLYWYAKDGRFIWSSEIKGILAHEVDRTPDEQAVAIAAALGYIPGDRTLFKHVRKLNLSQCVTFDLGKKAVSASYFRTPSEGYFPEDPDEAFKLLIEEHLQSKQPVAINLSGGLDSALLVHEMSRLGHPIRTYTTSFEGGSDGFNADALLARRLAEDYGTRHEEVAVTKETFLSNFAEAYLAVEEPNYNISLPAYLQIAKREGARGDGNRVILSGDGGDELFAGYPHYKESRRIDRMRLLLTPWLFDALKNRHARYRYDLGRDAERWLSFRAFQKRYVRGAQDRLTGHLESAVGPYLGLYGMKRDSAYRMMVHDRVLWMGGENFIRSDKLFMSQSLELRSPLSYHPFRMHWDARLKPSDYVGVETNKPFLRQHYLGKLPDYIVKRPDKTGWRSPIQEWYDGRFKELFLDAVATAERGGDLVDWKAVKASIEGKPGWPGKQAHLYVSLALLSKGYGLKI
jgi:asparagine synthase (glutamine-hydrolysing)